MSKEIPVDLFGRPLKKAEYSTRGPYGQKKLQMKYRRAEPGAVKRCKTCGNHLKVSCNKDYHKCAVLGCSASEATDIRMSFVCNEWRERNN